METKKRMAERRKPAEGDLFADSDFEQAARAEAAADYDFEEVFRRLGKSDFRRRFRLSDGSAEYAREKGPELIRRHAADIIRKRLAPAHPANDGRQTPMRGHPVFVAQHATGCCCRGCLMKWHGIPRGRELTAGEQDYIVALLAEWIKKQL